LIGPGDAILGIVCNRPGTITGGGIVVDAADASRTYDLQILVNGVSAAVIALALSTLVAYSTALSVAVVAGDVVSMQMVKTSGTGASTFNDMHAYVEISV
jgi:hypothetical protein